MHCSHGNKNPLQVNLHICCCHNFLHVRTLCQSIAGRTLKHSANASNVIPIAVRLAPLNLPILVSNHAFVAYFLSDKAHIHQTHCSSTKFWSCTVCISFVLSLLSVHISRYVTIWPIGLLCIWLALVLDVIDHWNIETRFLKRIVALYHEQWGTILIKAIKQKRGYK